MSQSTAKPKKFMSPEGRLRDQHSLIGLFCLQEALGPWLPIECWSDCMLIRVCSGCFLLYRFCCAIAQFYDFNFSLLVHIPVCSNVVFSVKDEHTSHLLNTVQTYQQMTREGRLLQIDFSTLVDYLHLLRACSLILSRAGRNSMLYLAAAVSDFYIPRDKMVMIPTHEVQTQNLLQTWGMSLSYVVVFLFVGTVSQVWLPVKLFASFCFLIQK